jgi:hypothetical protein
VGRELNELITSMALLILLLLSTDYLARANKIPRWRGLNHFTKVMDISFTDGTKNEDISKVGNILLTPNIPTFLQDYN